MKSSFEDVLQRLKAESRLKTDKAVAELLGMGEKAFNARKKRGAFPEDKLFAVVHNHPEMKMDVAYILSGARQAEHARARAASVASYAGRLGNETMAPFAGELIAADSARSSLRNATFKMLVNYAELCDDENLNLLLRVADALRKAAALSSQR